MPRADKLLHLTLTIYDNISNSFAVNSNPNHHNQTIDTHMVKKPSTASANPSTMSATNGPCSNNNNTSSSSNNKLYKGVRKRKWGKWVSEIRLPNSRERIWLGSYDTQEKAARAFDAALYCLRGHHASFNFPDTPLNINNVAFHGSVGHKHSLSPQEIQEVAAQFANDAPPMELSTQEQEVPSESSQLGAKSNSSNSVTESTSTCNGTLCSAAHVGVEPLDVFDMFTRYTSNGSACPPCRNDGVGQVDYGDLRAMDWTFFDMLDDLNGVACSNYGELLYSSQLYEDNNGDQLEGEDAFSNHSFLWSWNF